MQGSPGGSGEPVTLVGLKAKKGFTLAKGVTETNTSSNSYRDSYLAVPV
jgi:hypothetical protein